MSDIQKQHFLRDYSKKLMEGTAALFIGAGLSRPAGFVDWKELMREIADDLKLEIDKEYDLIAVAQYHHNTRKTRQKLNEKLIEEFTKDAQPTQNHPLVAQLPIHTVWTTNYDTLIEDAFKQQHKRTDVKITAKNVAQTRPGCDVTIFKMHGDVSQPDDAVLTKDDFESYSTSRELFTIRLKSDLVSQTFLFLGYSFNDPNIEYILSRIRALLGKDTPTHYCIMRRPQPQEPATPASTADYEYELRKLDLRVSDLQRFGIQTVLIDSYSEITELLQELNKRAFLLNVFVSGSAATGSADFDYARLLGFSRKLGREIFRKNYNLISGYGFAVGSEVIVGVMEEAGRTQANIQDRLILRPFPRTVEAGKKQEVYRRWREAMVSMAGFCIFLAGNKSAGTKKIVLGDGVREEFNISTTAPTHSYPIPVGATGFVAKELWEQVHGDQARYYGQTDVSTHLQTLNDPNKADEEILQAIFSIIESIRSFKHKPGKKS